MRRDIRALPGRLIAILSPPPAHRPRTRRAAPSAESTCFQSVVALPDCSCLRQGAWRTSVPPSRATAAVWRRLRARDCSRATFTSSISDSSLAQTSRPRRLTRQANARIGQVAWSPDDRSIIYDAEVVPMSNHLWRVPVDGASHRSGSRPPDLRVYPRPPSPATASHSPSGVSTSTFIGSTLPGRHNRCSHRRSWIWTQSTRRWPTDRVQFRADCRDSGNLGRRI